MDGLFTFLIFAVIFYLLMRYGCGAHMVHGHGGSHSHQDEYDDPVCGMKVKQDEGYGKTYQGVAYRFCTRSCLDKFDANPEQYIHSNSDKEVQA